jgi:pilus assembly protein CpaC
MRKLFKIIVVGACLVPVFAPGALADNAGMNGVAASDPARHDLQILLGTQQTITLGRPAYRMAVGDPKIAAVHPLQRSGGRQLLITGANPGVTSLMVWEVGSARPEVWRLRVNAAAPTAPLAAPAPGMPRVTGEGAAMTLSGDVANQMRHEAALEAAELAAGKNGKVIDQSIIPVDDEVQVDVKVVEFSKTVLKQVGINIFSSTGGFTLGTFAPNTLNGISFPVSKAGAIPNTVGAEALNPLSVTGALPFAQAFNLLGGVGNNGLSAYLSMLEGNNLLRILAQPTLVAMNGHTASFLAGGEIPIPVPQSTGGTTPTVTIEYKPYGVSLKLTPTILSAQRIALKVAPSVSQLDYVHAVQINGYSVPALLTRRADTTVTLGNGESLVIGGLVDRQMQQDINKVPLLGDIPILGAFFRSINYSNSDQELVIIVTPHLVQPIAAGAKLPALPGAAFAHSRFNLGKSLLIPGSEYTGDSSGPGYAQ